MGGGDSVKIPEFRPNNKLDLPGCIPDRKNLTRNLDTAGRIANQRKPGAQTVAQMEKRDRNLTTSRSRKVEAEMKAQWVERMRGAIASYFFSVCDLNAFEVFQGAYRASERRLREVQKTFQSMELPQGKKDQKA